ncbi:DMT family transporter [Flavobacterium aurantiibacter]|uniref:EamA family transporter n=1 Tax=Flavobacterium aurantiibacter TaxID=2023067 RepID=A0A255ZVY3_9FLAO|nr:EamA family transporter [Flavobacterium aurantiibacter]OYQ45571.1 EamA family transporter [Flavobacterium aurantiibacter]
MEQKNILKGVLFVGAGAAVYGMLATFVKLAYADKSDSGIGFTTAEVTTSQFALGILFTALLVWINGKSKIQKPSPTSKEIKSLIIAGTSTGLTSIFYYLSVKFIPVSIAIVLLMQTVWIGVALEALLRKQKPSTAKLLAIAVVLFGTLLATKAFEAQDIPDWRGLVLGFLAACSFTTTMFTANSIATGAASEKRSFWMLIGGACMVFPFALATQSTPFNFEIFYTWGIILALFGTVIPPILLNKGFPLTGIGLGSIVASLELPVSVLMAFFLLNESVSGFQWLGIILILIAVVLINRKAKLG